MLKRREGELTLTPCPHNAIQIWLRLGIGQKVDDFIVERDEKNSQLVEFGHFYLQNNCEYPHISYLLG